MLARFRNEFNVTMNCRVFFFKYDYKPMDVIVLLNFFILSATKILIGS